MNKNLTVRLSIAFAILAVSYTGFWFFKASQIKQLLNNFIESENAILAEDFKTHNSGISLPASQKAPALSAGKISVSNFPLLHEAKIENFRFDTLSNYVTTKNVKIRIGFFSSDFTIKLPEPLLIGDSASNFTQAIQFNKDAQINISLANNQISQLHYTGSGFKILDHAKNILLTIESKNSQFEFSSKDGNSYKGKNSGYKIFNANNNIVFDGESLSFDVNSITSEDKKITAKIAVNLKNFQCHIANVPSNNIKSNFTTSIAMVLTPNNSLANEVAKQAPYVISTNVENLDFFNSIFKISINGNFATFTDDLTPSGLINVKIENLDNLITNLITGIGYISSDALKSKNSSELTTQMFAGIAIEFLKSTNIALKTLAIKNPLSKKDLSVFEIKRNKGENTFINQLPYSEAALLFRPKAAPKNLNAQKKPVASITVKP